MLTKQAYTTRDTARRSRNRNSEYLAQRRQDRKGRNKNVKIIRKNNSLSHPNLASLRLGGSNSDFFLAFFAANLPNAEVKKGAEVTPSPFC